MKARKPKTSSLFAFGEFGNVTLTPAELGRLHERIGEPATRDYIDALSEYKAAKRTKYVSDYAVILMWLRRDNKGKPSLDNREHCEAIHDDGEGREVMHSAHLCLGCPGGSHSWSCLTPKLCDRSQEAACPSAMRRPLRQR